MTIPQFGTEDQFTTLREFLRHSDFTEKTICERIGLSRLEDLFPSSGRGSSPSISATSELLNLLIRLFLLGEYVSDGELAAWVPARARAAIHTMGLLRREEADAQRHCATVALYPAHGLYIASDRWTTPDHSPPKSFEDIVYPALTPNTRQFLEILPAEPCESFLDLGSGTGILALANARYAREAWATDITARSTQFAEFNRLLNGIGNLTVKQGDLYEPVGDQTFDRIVAHPPYMPVLRANAVYYDGGEDGERVTRRIIEGLPRHLRRAGLFYSFTLGSDRPEGTFEQRIGQWLGDAQSDFDVLLLVQKHIEPSRFAAESALKSCGGIAEAEKWKSLFERQQIKELVFGCVVIQRKAADRPAFTVRRAMGPRSGRAEAEWVVRWETASAEPRITDFLARSRPIASPHLELQVRHRLRNGELTPESFTLLTDHPFSMQCEVQPWLSFLLARCDGRKTTMDHFEYCKQNGLIHRETPVLEFVRLLRTLVSGGFLEVEGFRPPAAAG